MKPLRIIFMGSPEFAVPSLELLHDSPHYIAAVVSNPDKRRGRRSKPTPTDVKKRALELGLTTVDAVDLNSEDFIRNLSELEPDLIVTVAFRILPESILAIPEKGSVNLHASLLPKYRGAAPIHRAVMNGETETGCTVFFLNKKVDAGEIIKQKKTVIGPLETTGDVYERLKTMGAAVLLESVNDIATDSAERIPQDSARATPAPKLFKENTKLDFHKSAREVHNKIRGLNPFPIAWCHYDDKKMNIYKAKPGPELKLQPGKLYASDDALLVGCGEGTIEIRELQLPGTKRMTGKDFINGYDISLSFE
ncbi:MAG: methionyl-tRNA formyltransferase [Balneolaceae bacterium]